MAFEDGYESDTGISEVGVAWILFNLRMHGKLLAADAAVGPLRDLRP